MSPGWTTKGLPALRVGPAALADVGELTAGLRVRRALVVTDAGVRAAGWANRVALAVRAAGIDASVWDRVRPDPDDSLVHACRAAVEAGGYDGLVGVGGGSVIDVAKACSGLLGTGGQLADHAGLGRLTEPGPPVVAVATTPGSGAELSRHAVIATAGGRKYAVSGPHLAPRAVVVDPDTFATAPADVLVDTVLDALIHAIEAYLARAASPYTDIVARAAVATITGVAEAALSEPGDCRSAVDLVTGCLAASAAMAEANAGVIHALGYPLTSVYGIPHGRANALVAGAALQTLAAARPDRCAELARLWAAPGGHPDDLAGAFTTLFGRLTVPRSLADHGVPRDRLGSLARLAAGYQPVLRNTPVPLAEADLTAIYEQAWAAAAQPERAR